MRVQWQVAGLVSVLAGSVMAACAADESVVDPRPSVRSSSQAGLPTDPFQFTPLAASSACTNGGSATAPLVLPAGYTQIAVASEPSFQDVPDMSTQNETGPNSGRYLYRTHEVGSNGSVSVTDLVTGQTKTLVQRTDWEALDGITWTPWGTILFAEETNAAGRRDPNVPAAVAGLVYEIFLNPADPMTATSVVARPAIGSKSHEGMKFDKDGNLYSISERTPGYIFKFVPDVKGDLSAGQSYVLKIDEPAGGTLGAGSWVALDRAAVQIDASAAGDAVGATGYGRPEDLEWREGILFAAITSENRVIAVRNTSATRFRVYNYVARGLNVTNEFLAPDNLALDKAGYLYITEDPGGNTNSGKLGDDIWVAGLPTGPFTPARNVGRFASLNDCEAEPTGVYFDTRGDEARLFVNIQHRGGDRLDKVMAVTRTPTP